MTGLRRTDTLVALGERQVLVEDSAPTKRFVSALCKAEAGLAWTDATHC